MINLDKFKQKVREERRKRRKKEIKKEMLTGSINNALEVSDQTLGLEIF